MSTFLPAQHRLVCCRGAGGKNTHHPEQSFPLASLSHNFSLAKRDRTMTTEPFRSLVFTLIGALVGSCDISAGRKAAVSCSSLQRRCAFAFPNSALTSWRGASTSIAACSRSAWPVQGRSWKINKRVHLNLRTSSDFLGLQPTFLRSPSRCAVSGPRSSQSSRLSQLKCLNQYYEDEGNDEVPRSVSQVLKSPLMINRLIQGNEEEYEEIVLLRDTKSDRVIECIVDRLETSECILQSWK